MTDVNSCPHVSCKGPLGRQGVGQTFGRTPVAGAALLIPAGRIRPAADVKPDELFCARNDAPARGTAAGGSPLARVPNRVALSRARFHLCPRPEIAAWRSQCPNVC